MDISASQPAQQRKRIPPTRVDAAHPASPVPEPAEGAGPAVPPAGSGDDLVAEGIPSFHLQANQLVQHLRQQQQELDQRESQVHAMVAQLENRQRSLRLWEQEQVASITRQQQELEFRARQLEALEHREAELRDQQSQLQQQQQEWIQERQQWVARWQEQNQRQEAKQQERLALIERQEAELRQRDRELQRQADCLDSLRSELQRIAERLRAHQQRLESPRPASVTEQRSNRGV